MSIRGRHIIAQSSFWHEKVTAGVGTILSILFVLALYMVLLTPTTAHAYGEGGYYGEGYYYGYGYGQGYYYGYGYGQGYYYGYGYGYGQGGYGLTLSKNSTVNGNVSVIGSISKGSGTFMIDDPLDPKNKLLYHSFVESPDVMNIYDGIALLDSKGAVTVTLPDYFVALNKDFRYLATPVGASMPDLHLSARVHRGFLLFGNIELRISGGVAGGSVSWQVTGIRHDPFIELNPINVIVDKGPAALVDKGAFVCPECYTK
jgi:hypothetical protein